MNFNLYQTPYELLSLYTFLSTPVVSEAGTPHKGKAIAFRDTSLLQRATCLVAYHARTAPRTINPIARKRALNRNRDAKSSRT